MLNRQLVVTGMCDSRLVEVRAKYHREVCAIVTKPNQVPSKSTEQGDGVGPSALCAANDKTSPCKYLCLKSIAKHGLSSLIYLLLLCLMTAGGAFRYQALNSYHRVEYRGQCEEVMAGLDNYKYIDMLHMTQLSNLMNKPGLYTSRSGFLLNQITANRCTLNSKSADSSKSGAIRVRNRHRKHVAQNEVFKEQRQNKAVILDRRKYVVAVKPQVALTPCALISSLASFLFMMHVKQGMGDNELWIPWDRDRPIEYDQCSLQNRAGDNRLQAAYYDARELSLVGEVPLPLTDQGHNMYVASNQYKAMRELLQVARKPWETFDTMHQCQGGNADTVGGMRFRLQLFLDLSMVALVDWENMVKEIKQIIPPVQTKTQKRTQFEGIMARMRMFKMMTIVCSEEYHHTMEFGPGTEECVYTTVRAGSHSLSNIVRKYGPCFDNKFSVTSPKVVYFEVTMERDEDNYKPNPWLHPWMRGLSKARVREIGRFPKHQAMEQPAGGTSRIILSVAGSSSGGDKPGNILSSREDSDKMELVISRTERTY